MGALALPCPVSYHHLFRNYRYLHTLDIWGYRWWRIKAGKECGIGSGQKGMNKVAIKHLKKDQVMSRLIKRHGLVELKPRRASTFQSLTQAIIHQQLSGKAAGTILGRFFAL